MPCHLPAGFPPPAPGEHGAVRQPRARETKSSLAALLRYFCSAPQQLLAASFIMLVILSFWQECIPGVPMSIDQLKEALIRYACAQCPETGSQPIGRTLGTSSLCCRLRL
eukprot:549850-Amphidinium_carterae.1